MNIMLILAFLFFIGCVLGWCIEVLFRRFEPDNKTHKWINPGFLAGPYLPLYGSGLCVMYLMARWESVFHIQSPVWSKVVLILIIGVSMTVLEYIAGAISVYIMHVRLWDYSRRKFNIQGIICPLFSLIWTAIGALYCIVIHPRILAALEWLSRNLAFSFFIGLFFGVFIIDLCYSLNMVAKIKKFADENQILVRYEELKLHIRQEMDARKKKYNFMFALRAPAELAEQFKSYAEKEKRAREELLQKIREKKASKH